MTFIAKKRTLRCSQELFAPAEKVFPLLCPRREYDWIASWSCEIVYSESGYAEPDCVFVTDLPGDIKETWLVDRYEPARLIQFVRFTQSRVIRYSIELHDNNNGTTTAYWTQVIIALNEDGNSYIDQMKDAAYENRIGALEKMLNHYIKTGKRLESIEDNKK